MTVRALLKVRPFPGRVEDLRRALIGWEVEEGPYVWNASREFISLHSACPQIEHALTRCDSFSFEVRGFTCKTVAAS